MNELPKSVRVHRPLSSRSSSPCTVRSALSIPLAGYQHSFGPEARALLKSSFADVACCAVPTGPPGVGKTYMHRILAQALYNASELCEQGAVALDSCRHITFTRSSALRFSFFSCRHSMPVFRNGVARGTHACRALIRQIASAPRAEAGVCVAYKVVYGTDFRTVRGGTSSPFLFLPIYLTPISADS